MSTRGTHVDEKSGEFPDRSGPAAASKVKLHIQMLERGSDEMASEMHWAVNGLLVFFAFCCLYGFYILFGWAWLTAMRDLGEDLNWAFFGAAVAIFGGMGGGVAYSMKSQQIGWWEPLAPGDVRRERDPRGKCCGFQIY